MKLTRKKLRQLIQEHIWLHNQDAEEIINLRNALSPAERQMADEMAAEDPGTGLSLGGVVDHYGPEKEEVFNVIEPDWYASDIYLHLDEILDDQYDPTSVDEIAKRLEDEYEIDEQYMQDLSTPIDNKGNVIPNAPIPVINRQTYEKSLRKYVHDWLSSDERVQVYKDGTVIPNPDYHDYEPY